MSDKPVKFVSRAKNTNTQTIAYLEDFLTRAKAGEITEFVMVYKSDGEYAHCWTGVDNLFEMLGCMGRMIYSLNKRIDKLNGVE